MVTVASSKIFAIIAGAIQSAPIGFPHSLVSKTALTTSSFTCASAPWNATVERFLATPNPPGKIKPSKSTDLYSLMSLIAPLAILADSTNTFLLSSVSSPVMWLIT